jgi:HTH-type transcriptional regulator/antitoxin HigA
VKLISLRTQATGFHPRESSLSNQVVGTTQECASQVWPLRTEDNYLEARDIVDKLATKGEEALTEAERDQLEIFSILMERYEEEHYFIDQPDLSPIELLNILMRENGMTASDLGRLLGDRSLGHKILTGERKLSKSHIKALSEYFKVEASAFL